LAFFIEAFFVEDEEDKGGFFFRAFFAEAFCEDEDDELLLPDVPFIISPYIIYLVLEEVLKPQ
jgi:hypothetical protein